MNTRYCWRTELKEGVLKAFSPPLIDRDRLTVAEMLRQVGYSTACIGKWHLGLGWQRSSDGSIDFSQPLSDSPLDHGFDHYFGISASLNMEPYCYIEGHHTVGIPSIPKTPVQRGQNPEGLMVEGWKDEEVNTRITNGPHSFNTDELSVYGHDQTAGLRGQKADIWEGGHRVPFIASWPSTIPGGVISSELVELTDFMATCAHIVGVELPASAAVDSFSILPVLLGEKLEGTIREAVISHSWKGMFSIRSGRWKYIEGQHSGGFEWMQEFESDPDAPPGQLYDMEQDESEINNMYVHRPDIVDKLQGLLNQYRQHEYSRPQ